MVEVFFLLDRNKDGALVRDEIPGASETAFRAADRSGDGRLTVPEYTDARMKDYAGGRSEPGRRAHPQRDGRASRRRPR